MLLVLVSAALCAGVVLVLGGIAFLDVAFRQSAVPVLSPGEWKGSSQLRGLGLYRWLAATAERVTLQMLAGRRDASVASRLASAVQTGAEIATDPVPPGMVALGAAGATGFCSTPIGVTPPEAIELAEYLRGSQRSDRIALIRRQALDNEHAFASMDPTSRHSAVLCPLACVDGGCLASEARPIQCRARCQLVVGDIGAAEAAVANRAEMVAAGASRGLATALEETGLEGKIYELNSALAKALSTPDSAQRWAVGERVFADCTPYAKTASLASCAP